MNWLDRVRAGLREHEDARDEVAAGETSGAAPVGSRVEDVSSGAPTPAPKLDELPATIGPHKVVGVLGRGGVGVVYVARNERLDRLVAVKVLRVDRVRAPELVERFDIEARAAARLRHPNIVGIHEVGEDAGRQYLVMELIPGRSLAARLRDDGPLPAREAARVTERVARALAYAHARSILHRDIKPANVLMAEGGEPMLTDFGMAKFFDKDQEEVKSPTVSGQVMGTPAYMPPEQARGEHGRVDRRSDVYSLGATLYEMLTNQPPWTATSVMAILGQVTSQEPVPPPSRFAPGLDPDLETICLKCLEKEPGERYLTADALACDLARWLKDEPIVARRPSLTMRSRKWLRRNRTLTQAMGAAVGCALVVLVAGTIGFVGRLGEERDLADAAAADAAHQAERARARAAVAQDALRVLIFEVRDELGDVPGERVRRVRGELLEHALGALEQLRDAGLADGSLLQAAEAQRQIGELRLARADVAGETAAAAFERALELSREAVRATPDDPAAQLDLSQSLVRLARALRLADPERARALADEGLAAALGRAPAVFEVTARRAVSMLARDASELPRAAEQAETAAQLCRAAGPSMRGLLSELLEDLAAIRSDQNDLPRARAAFDEAMTCAGPFDPVSARLLAGLAGVMAKQGDLPAATATFGRAIAAARTLLAADPTQAQLRESLADLLHQLATLERRAGDDDAAARSADEAAAIRRALLRDEPRSADRSCALASSLVVVARLRSTRGDLVAARDAATEAVEALRPVSSFMGAGASTRFDLCLALVELGRARAGSGDRAGALAAQEEAVGLARALVSVDPTSGRDRHALAVALDHLGMVALGLGQRERALLALDEALAITRELDREDSTNVDQQEDFLHLLRHAGSAHAAAGQAAEARRLLEEALRAAEGLLAREPSRLVARRFLALNAGTLGELLLELGERDAALPVAEVAIDSYRACADATSSTADRKDLAVALALRARLREQLGQTSDAIADLEAQASLTRALLAEEGSIDARRAHSLALLPLATLRQGRSDLEVAVALWTELLENHRALVALAPDHAPDLGHLESKLAASHLALAYALHERGEHAASVAHFASALADAALRGDLGRGNLYTGACAAARAAAAAPDDAARVALRGRALEWLADDVARQRRFLARAEEELTRTDVTAERRALLERARPTVLEHLAQARRDPDLAELQGTPELEALLAPP